MPLSQLLVARWQSLAFLGFRSLLSSSPGIPPVYMSVSKIPLFIRAPFLLGYRPTLLPCDLTLTNYFCNNPISKSGHILRSCGGRPSTYKFEGGAIQSTAVPLLQISPTDRWRRHLLSLRFLFLWFNHLQLFAIHLCPGSLF